MPKLNIGEINFYYELAGQGQPIVFIHGLGSSTRDWAAQAAYFSDGFKVVTFDLRGHGQSDKPRGPYSVPLFATDIAQLIKTLRLDPAHVVGLSLGGMVAFQLVVSFPTLVKSLAIVNSVPEYRLRSLKARFDGLRRLFIVHVLGMRKMGQFLGKQLFPKPEQAALRQIFIDRWAENDRWAYSAAMRAVVGWSVLDRLHAVRCPVLIVSADEDIFPLSFKRAYTEKISQAELVVIPNSRHFTTVECSEAFNEVLDTFLAKQA